jgi:hypothetical protein
MIEQYELDYEEIASLKPAAAKATAVATVVATEAASANAIGLKIDGHRIALHANGRLEFVEQQRPKEAYVSRPKYTTIFRPRKAQKSTFIETEFFADAEYEDLIETAAETDQTEKFIQKPLPGQWSSFYAVEDMSLKYQSFKELHN